MRLQLHSHEAGTLRKSARVSPAPWPHLHFAPTQYAKRKARVVPKLLQARSQRLVLSTAHCPRLYSPLQEQIPPHTFLYYHPFTVRTPELPSPRPTRKQIQLQFLHSHILFTYVPYSLPKILDPKPPKYPCTWSPIFFQDTQTQSSPVSALSLSQACTRARHSTHTTLPLHTHPTLHPHPTH